MLFRSRFLRLDLWTDWRVTVRFIDFFAVFLGASRQLYPLSPFCPSLVRFFIRKSLPESSPPTPLSISLPALARISQKAQRDRSTSSPALRLRGCDRRKTTSQCESLFKLPRLSTQEIRHFQSYLHRSRLHFRPQAAIPP